MMKYIFVTLIVIVLGFGQIQWHTEIVDSSHGLLGLSVSMSLDNYDQPHIAYTLNSDQDFIIYAFKHDSIWEREIVDSSLFGGPYWGLPFYGLSLVLIHDSVPSISYYYYDSLSNSTKICYAYRDSLTWTHEVLDTMDSTTYAPQMYYTSLKLGTAGLPGIAYAYWNFIDSTQVIKYLKYNGTDWDSLMVNDSCEQWDYGPCMSIDNQNQPHIAYYQNDTLKYGFYDNQTSTWNILYRKYIGFFGERASLSLALDSQNYARIAYSHNGGLTYSWWDGSNWHSDNVISIGFWGVAINLALDTLENPHITYTVEFNFWLEYCCKDTIWHLYGPIEPNTMTLLDHSLAIDRLSNPHVSYETGSGYLNHAKGVFTGIVENENSNSEKTISLQLFPNPAANYINVQYMIAIQGDVELSLYDVTGAKIMSIQYQAKMPGLYQESLGITNLAAGVYFLRIDNLLTGKAATTKFIKIE